MYIFVAPPRKVSPPPATSWCLEGSYLELNPQSFHQHILAKDGAGYDVYSGITWYYTDP